MIRKLRLFGFTQSSFCNVEMGLSITAIILYLSWIQFMFSCEYQRVCLFTLLLVLCQVVRATSFSPYPFIFTPELFSFVDMAVEPWSIWSFWWSDTIKFYLRSFNMQISDVSSDAAVNMVWPIGPPWQSIMRPRSLLGTYHYCWYAMYW